jgi:uncharacterized Zn finger protein
MSDSIPETIVFAVQGSSPEPYRVTFKRKYPDVCAFCTCPAGMNGQYCKHRIDLIHGVLDGVVAGNQEQLTVLSDWLRDSRLGLALEHLGAAEFALEQAKRRVSSAKKVLSAAMYGSYKGSQ